MGIHCLVFGYGSLIHPDSANRTLRRPEPPHDFQPATLRGYQRAWRLHVRRHFADAPPDRQTDCVVLDIVPRPGMTMNGVLIPVTTDELARLDQREAHYDRVDVTGAIEPAPPHTVITYAGKDEHTHPPADAVIAETYLRVVIDRKSVV